MTAPAYVYEKLGLAILYTHDDWNTQVQALVNAANLKYGAVLRAHGYPLFSFASSTGSIPWPAQSNTWSLAGCPGICEGIQDSSLYVIGTAKGYYKIYAAIGIDDSGRFYLHDNAGASNLQAQIVYMETNGNGTIVLHNNCQGSLQLKYNFPQAIIDITPAGIVYRRSPSNYTKLLQNVNGYAYQENVSSVNLTQLFTSAHQGQLQATGSNLNTTPFPTWDSTYSAYGDTYAQYTSVNQRGCNLLYEYGGYSQIYDAQDDSILSVDEVSFVNGLKQYASNAYLYRTSGWAWTAPQQYGYASGVYGKGAFSKFSSYSTLPLMTLRGAEGFTLTPDITSYVQQVYDKLWPFYGSSSSTSCYASCALSRNGTAFVTLVDSYSEFSAITIFSLMQMGDPNACANYTFNMAAYVAGE